MRRIAELESMISEFKNLKELEKNAKEEKNQTEAAILEILAENDMTVFEGSEGRVELKQSESIKVKDGMSEQCLKWFNKNHPHMLTVNAGTLSRFFKSEQKIQPFVERITKDRLSVK